MKDNYLMIVGIINNKHNDLRIKEGDIYKISNTYFTKQGKRVYYTTNNILLFKEEFVILKEFENEN